MRTYWQYSLSFFFFICINHFTFAQGISMSPTRLFFSGKPGETINQTVVLNNSSETDYVFNINTKDWKREADGSKVYFDPGTLDFSNAHWISTPESVLNLPANTTKEIVVTMTIPQEASSTAVTNSMLFFTQIGKQKDNAEQQNGIGIIALFEFGLHVYCTPPNNSTQSLEIISIDDITEENTLARKVAIGIENDGNIISDASVELEFTNTTTGEEVKLDPINISMLPNTKQVVTFKVPEGLSGTYLGVTIVKMAGTNDLRVGEKNFEF